VTIATVLPLVAIELAQQPQHLRASARVEIPGELVGEQQLR
jgi:hypothetical protein